MRGVVAGGMVTSLEKLNLLHCFDLVVGSSAGACAGAYFLAGQAEYGTSIYFEDINNSHFIDYARLRRGLPIVDIDFLIDHVMRDVKSLNVEELFKTGVDFRIVCTDIDSGSEYVAKILPGSGVDVFEVLRATSKLPLLAGLRPVDVDGHRCMDGGVSSQIPLHVAINAGATHLLALPTRPRFRPSTYKFSISEALIANAMSCMISPALGRTYLQRKSAYARAIETIQCGTQKENNTSPAVFGIFLPPEKILISRTERSGEILRQGARDGATAVRNAFQNGW